MNNPDTKLVDLIHVEKGVIPSELCDIVIKDIEKGEWEKHYWYTNHTGEYHSEETKELDIQHIHPDSHLQKLLAPVMNHSASIYCQKYTFKKYKRTREIMSKYSPIRFNDDYEGADLYFWDENVVSLGKGDIVIFPSLFLFPHGVTEIKKGVRYSGVAWSW